MRRRDAGGTGLRAAAGRLRTDRGGVVALEFAFVSVALMMIVMGTMHIGFCLYVQSVLDQAAALIAIQAETTGGDPTAAGYQDGTVCPSIAGLLDCSKVRVALFPVASYQDIAVPSVSNAGGSRSLMLLQLSYDVPIPTWPVLALTGGSALTVVANVPFVNEF